VSLASITHIIEANDNGALAGETRVIDATSGKVANLDKLARILDEDEGKLTERMRTMVGRARSETQFSTARTRAAFSSKLKRPSVTSMLSKSRKVTLSKPAVSWLMATVAG
jgi:hypothetical protein